LTISLFVTTAGKDVIVELVVGRAIVANNLNGGGINGSSVDEEEEELVLKVVPVEAVVVEDKIKLADVLATVLAVDELVPAVKVFVAVVTYVLVVDDLLTVGEVITDPTAAGIEFVLMVGILLVVLV